MLSGRPLILPPQHFVYPKDAEEVERGALEVLVHPEAPGAQPFLATCALGFRDAAVPTGLWSAPNPEEICAVSGGYAYLIDTTRPERFTMIAWRPVLEVRALAALEEVPGGLLLFVGHRALVAWGAAGEAWRTEKLSDEGLTITGVEGGVVHGVGWEMMRDRETEFAVDVRTGRRCLLGG